jgi:hypothetical protein
MSKRKRVCKPADEPAEDLDSTAAWAYSRENEKAIVISLNHNSNGMRQLVGAGIFEEDETDFEESAFTEGGALVTAKHILENVHALYAKERLKIDQKDKALQKLCTVKISLLLVAKPDSGACIILPLNVPLRFLVDVCKVEIVLTTNAPGRKQGTAHRGPTHALHSISAEAARSPETALAMWKRWENEDDQTRRVAWQSGADCTCPACKDFKHGFLGTACALAPVIETRCSVTHVIEPRVASCVRSALHRGPVGRWQGSGECAGESRDGIACQNDAGHERFDGGGAPFHQGDAAGRPVEQQRRSPSDARPCQEAGRPVRR